MGRRLVDRGSVVVKLSAYAEYKPSGVDWFAEVPVHWDVKRLKGAATYWVSNVDKVPADDETPVRLCNYTDVYYHDHIRPAMGLMETTATPQEIRRFGLQEGDILITKDSEDWSDIAVPALVVESAPNLLCGYHLAIIRPKKKTLLGRFLLRTFQSGAVNQQFQVAATGVTRYGLPNSSIGEAWLPLPSRDEQRAIADFLDRETAKIDTLAAKTRTLITRLKEKRTALISRTVTSGLPPDAARPVGLDPQPNLKPTGVEWLGEVPEHWEVKPLKWAVMFQRGHDLPAEQRAEGTVPLVSSSGVSATHSRPKAKGPGLVTGRYGTIGEFYLVTDDYWPLNTTLYSIDLRGNEPRFLQALLRHLSPLFLLHAVKSAVPGVDRNDVHPITTVVPPVAEQAAIAEFLERKISKIDAVVAKVEAAIERLQEYRTALITAVVTGKFDVRTTTLVSEPVATSRGIGASPHQ